MPVLDFLRRATETTGEQVSAFSDPDGYYFPQINKALGEGEPGRARTLLEAWRGKKIIKFKTEGRSTQEIAAIQQIYNAKLQEIAGVRGGGPLGMDRSMVATLLIGGGVILFAYYAFKKGK